MSIATPLRTCVRCDDELGLGAFDADQKACRACLRPRGQQGPAEERKVCTACDVAKPLTEFARNRTKSGGWDTWCLACKREYQADYETGWRRRYKVNANRQGIFVCLCPVARLRPDNKTCRCGMPVVARMHPDLQARMAQKYPPIVDQRVVEVVA